MIQTIYVESGVLDHPRTQKIINKLKLPIVICDHYKEVFNPNNQNFRFQKNNTALILAEKKGHLVLPTPEGFGIGSHQNFYFSHMLNCLYDCRYCFLQGLYPSANYVLFVNYEDFMAEITATYQASDKATYFFSGYDCDSLAMESQTGFLEAFLPYFEKNPLAILELRTKSTQIRTLLKQNAFKNCVVAFSFTPEKISKQYEHRVPSVEKRIMAMTQLAEAGWQVGLRFDPLIYDKQFHESYGNLIKTIFQKLPKQAIHSVSMGPMRFPEKMYQKISSLYPTDPLLAHPLEKQNNIISYPKDLEKQMRDTIQTMVQDYLSKSIIFECHNF